LTVGNLKKRLENADDSWVIAFPIDAEGNDFKYVVCTSTGHLYRYPDGDFTAPDVDDEDEDWDEDDPEVVPVLFMEPYN
jgi:hypothetical protein